MSEKRINSVHLSWRPREDRQPILDGVSLALEPGFIYGMIGPNGAGKSSLLKHFLGLLQTPRQDGAVLLDQRDIRSYRAKALARELSLVPQKTDSDTDMTAEEMVMTGRYPYQSRWSGQSETDLKKTAAAMEAAGCRHLAGQPFRQLSGGEAQKVIIARAIAQDTGWMLLDEPVSSLDIRSQIEIMEQLRQLNRKNGISILMILHDVNLAASYCHRVIMMKEGRVMYAGDTAEALTPERLEALYGIGFSTVTGEDGRQYFMAKR